MRPNGKAQMRLEIAQSQIAEIAQTGVKAFPEEACGLLIGRITDRAWHVESVIPAEKIAAASERHHRYTIDPKVFLHTQRTAEAAGLEVVGFFHSHPNHPATPSTFDRERAWGSYVYVIVHVTPNGAQETTAWELVGEAMTPVKIDDLT